MNTVTPNNNNLSTTTLSSGIIYTGSTTNISKGSWIYNSLSIEQEKMILYIDLMAQLLGIDINFEKFSKMSTDEIKSFTRDLKLKKLIENDNR